MEPELHHEPTQPFGWRRRDARLDVRKYFAGGDGFFLACPRFHGLERGEPLLKQFCKLLVQVRHATQQPKPWAADSLFFVGHVGSPYGSPYFPLIWEHMLPAPVRNVLGIIGLGSSLLCLAALYREWRT